MANVSVVFGLLDDFARTRHNAFLAEMTPTDGDSQYSLCFRPLSVNRGSKSRFDCCYVTVSAEDVRRIGENRKLDSTLATALDDRLSELG